MLDNPVIKCRHSFFKKNWIRSDSINCKIQYVADGRIRIKLLEPLNLQVIELLKLKPED